MPISALTVALADPLVLTLYGSKWSQSARILQLLALYGAFSILCVLFSNILAGLGRTKLLFVMQLYWLVALVPAMVIGVHFDGVVGAALAHVIVIGPIILPFYVLTLIRMTGVRLRALAAAVLPALLLATVAGLAAREVARLLISTPLVALLAGGIVGGLIYGVATAPQFIAILNRGQGGKVRGQRILDMYQSGARLLGLPSATTAQALGPARPSAGSARRAVREHERRRAHRRRAARDGQEHRGDPDRRRRLRGADVAGQAGAVVAWPSP